MTANRHFELKSTAFSDGAEIPPKYTCDGADISPPLTWKNCPPQTKSFALVIDDPDAPDPKNPQRPWVHWVLYDIPADVSSLEEGMRQLPHGAKLGLNDWKKAGFGGACPPIGRHRYFHRLYALDTELQNLEKPTKAELEAAMKGHILEKTELVGTYLKKSER